MNQTLEKLPAWNGHFDPNRKGFGDTIFRGELRNLPYPAESVEIDSAIQAMYTDGYVLFPQVLNAQEVAALRAKMDSMGEDDEAYFVKNWCYNRHLEAEFHKDAELLQYMDKPGVIDVAEAIHAPGCQVIGGSFWTTGAGRDMGLHVDYLPISLPEEVHDDPRVKVPIFTATAHYYLNDMVAELGPTIIVPGSHRAGRPPDDETSWHGIDPQAVMVKAGDVCLFRGDLWHAAWKNTSETDRRYMMQVHYGNFQMTKWLPSLQHCESLYSSEVLAQATPRQRRLLGGK